jgi:hypothetical protein
MHRWECFLKQQSSITIYHLPIKENKLPFSISVCSKQTEVCCFHFPFASNQFCFQFCGILETWRHGDENMETWRHRHETWRHGDMDMDMDMERWRRAGMEAWRHGGMEAWGHGGIEERRHVDMCLSFVIFLFVDEETK